MIILTRNSFPNINAMQKFFEKTMGKKFAEPSAPIASSEERTREFAEKLVNEVKKGFINVGTVEHNPNGEGNTSRKINCIKLVRLHNSTYGLKEAKDLVDEFWNK